MVLLSSTITHFYSGVFQRQHRILLKRVLEKHWLSIVFKEMSVYQKNIATTCQH